MGAETGETRLGVIPHAMAQSHSLTGHPCTCPQVLALNSLNGPGPVACDAELQCSVLPPTCSFSHAAVIHGPQLGSRQRHSLRSDSSADVGSWHSYAGASILAATRIMLHADYSNVCTGLTMDLAGKHASQITCTARYDTALHLQAANCFIYPAYMSALSVSCACVMASWFADSDALSALVSHPRLSEPQ